MNHDVHGSPASPVRVIVAICTYNRNAPLADLLDRLIEVAEATGERAAVGVVVVDDNADRKAEPVVVGYEGRFALGIHYRVSGRQNISLARNLAVGTAAELGDWVAMTDDDCVPVRDWLVRSLDMAEQTDADAVTGPCILRVPPGSPSWLTDEPFLEDAQLRFDDGAVMHLAATNNSMISSHWWQAHPEIRFDEALGVVGGEDMVFYRTAVKAGLRVRFVAGAMVHGEEPAARATLGYQLRSRFWLGNTEFVTNDVVGDATRLRQALRAGNGLRKALQRPLVRVLHRQRPQLRYCVAAVLRAAGLMSGVLGLRVRHH
jgi:succinoglycan biosynthesis protein ExoM